ncbi:hypothetical protein ZWY2020_047826 [Hordeum vulgare]|nr:hypothetical protein ZWY2020_047826 [Hordeum vulgare]
MAPIKNSVQAMCLMAVVVMSITFLPSHVEGMIMDTMGTTVRTSCVVMKHCTIGQCQKNCSARGYDKDKSSCVSFEDNNCCCFSKGIPPPR